MSSEKRKNLAQIPIEASKKIFRSLKLAVKKPPKSAPDIDQELLRDCSVLKDRLELIKHLPSDSIVAEVGVLHGNYSKEILKRSNPRKLVLIDLTFEHLDKEVKQQKAVELLEGPSVDSLGKFPDSFFDWIYIDGDHSYDGVRKDMEIAARKTKPGGYLCFNDFARISNRTLGEFGVHQAVCEFMVRNRYPAAFFCFQKNALYDIAIRKPL